MHAFRVIACNVWRALPTGKAHVFGALPGRKLAASTRPGRIIVFGDPLLGGMYVNSCSTGGVSLATLPTIPLPQGGYGDCSGSASGLPIGSRRSLITCM